MFVLGKEDSFYKVFFQLDPLCLSWFQSIMSGPYAFLKINWFIEEKIQLIMMLPGVL